MTDDYTDPGTDPIPDEDAEGQPPVEDEEDET